MKRLARKIPRQVAICLAALLSVSSLAQTLARPGWTGSGMSTQSWFRHAVFYRVDTRSFAHSATDAENSTGTLKGITGRLDYIRDLGVDAILLEPLAVAGASTPVDPALGTIDDFDELSLQASKHDLRILLTLPQPDPALARFWLTRGVAGFYIPGAASSALQPIRKLLPTFVGQRILITDADLAATGSSTTVSASEMQLDSALLKLPTPPPDAAASQLRSALGQSEASSRSGDILLATDAAGTPSSISRFAPSGHEVEAAHLIGAVLLLNRSVPLINAGQELGLASAGGPAVMIPWGKAATPEPEPSAETTTPPPAAPVAPAPNPSERYVPYIAPVKPVKPAALAPPDPASVAGQELDPNSVLSFYRQLVQLHHGRPSVRDGDELLLNHDATDALILVRRPAHPSLATPPLVVICNLSATQLHLSLKPELTGMHLRGSFLRSVLHPGAQNVSMNLDAVSLPPFGVYIGELRY